MEENALFQSVQQVSCAKFFHLYIMRFCLAQKGHCSMSSLLLAASFLAAAEEVKLKSEGLNFKEK